MGERSRANLRIGIAEGSELVDLILEGVRINRTRADAVLAFEAANLGGAGCAVQAPVTPWTCAASLNFSSRVVAAAGCTNLPKRVPVFAKPHEGISMASESRAAKIVSVFTQQSYLACS
jgi:hypothetical protein